MTFIIQLIFFIFLSFTSLIFFAGLGTLLNFKNKNDFILDIFFGFIILSLIITTIHFFFKINLFLACLIILFGFYRSFKKYYFSIRGLNKDYFYLLIFVALIPIYISQKYHEDFGYYHLPYILNFVHDKIIFGLGNTNNGFVHNSIWLNTISLFYINENYDFVNLPIFLIYFIFIIFSLRQILSQKNFSSSNFFLIICIFYLSLKFTRISEFGNDIPSLIFSILAIFYFFKYEEQSDLDEKKFLFFSHVVFSVFAILIKFSSIPILLLTIFIFSRDFRNIYRELFNLKYLFIVTLSIIFFLQQFIYTGCVFFPSKITCINVPWFSDTFLTLTNNLELTNKSYSVAREFFSKEEYLKNFNWFPFWLKRNYMEIIEHIFTIIFPIIALLFASRETKSFKTFKFKSINFFIFFIIVGFCFWFAFSPVYRFGIIYFLCVLFIFTFRLFKNRFFSKNTFIVFFIICLTFNFVKNLKRIYEKDELYFGVSKIKNEYKIYDQQFDNDILVVRPDIDSNAKKGNGWQGRLCWDIKFLCSYNRININLRNNYLFISREK